MLSFLIGVLLPAAMSGNLKANISEDNFFEGIETVDEVVVKYHLVANSYVNYYLTNVTDEEIQDYSVTAYVADDECSNENLTTYCLSVIMNELLVDFELKLRSMEGEISFPTDQGTPSFSEAFSMALNDRAKIDREIQAARDSLDLTLAVYNQVQSVYPLHKELADLIGNMETYRDSLSAIRSKMELFPSRFNNATSPSCK